MKLEKPIVFKQAFNVFNDDRGYLSALDIENLTSKIPKQKFDFRYQLLSFNEKKDTFRGFHYQTKPFEQNKLIVIHSGEVLDLIVPSDNPLERDIEEFELTTGDAILIPSNIAHGFITLSNEVLMQYFLDKTYSEEHYKGINGNSFLRNNFEDKEFLVSPKDKALEQELI